MELKDQVCSLESSKRLKELGVKQESLFWWVDFINNACTTKDGKGFESHRFQCLYNDDGIYEMEDKVYLEIKGKYSAFTVAELGEMLRECPQLNWCYLYTGDLIFQPTEAEARAKMLIYLLENKLI